MNEVNPALTLIINDYKTMKKNIRKISLTIILAVAVLISFAQDTTSVVGGRRKQGLSVFKYARIDSAADFRHFKNYAEANITNNKLIIDQLKVHKTKGDSEMRAKYLTAVSGLEEKNNEMAIKIAMADMIGTRNWAAFKSNFTEEMTELTTGLKNVSNIHFINK